MTERLPASLSGKRLAREIMASAAPEALAHSLPAQSIYLAIQERGLDASIELLEVVSNEQTKVILDLDLWTRDRFHEERIWDWLALPDAAESLEILQKVLRNIDLKLAALLIGEHVDVQIFEEATDTPPGPRYSSPDKGKTWISVQLEDGQKHFLLSRFLALIFETSTELFYQLLAIPNVATQSMLEEEAFQERSKRLLSEGFPDDEQVASLHNPLPIGALSMRENAFQYGIDTPVVSPVLVGRDSDGPLLITLLSAIGSTEEYQSELTYITNAAILHFKIDISDHNEIEELIEGVRGVLNIGLELLQRQLNCAPIDALRKYGLSSLYQVGLSSVFEIRKLCLRTLTRGREKLTPELLHVAELGSKPLPRTATYLSTDGVLETSGALKLSSRGRALSHLAELDGIRRAVEAGVTE